MSYEVKGQGFILRIIPAREADVMVRMLLATGEKTTLFARAALKSKKRFGGVLQPFLNIEFRGSKRPSSEMANLEEAQLKKEFKGLQSNLDVFLQASYLVELVERSAQEGLENEQIYHLFGAALKALDGGLNPQGVVRQFEVKLLSVLGWLPELTTCGGCGHKGHLTMNAHHGIVSCEDCGIYEITLTSQIQKQINDMLSTSIMSESREVEKGLARLTHGLLQAHLGDKAFKTLQVINKI